MAPTLSYLTAANLRFLPVEGAIHPRLILEDRCLLAAHFIRVFPLSHPNGFISIQDEKGEEYGILETFVGLDEQSLSLVEAALDRRYFTPTISRIHDLRQDAGMWKFGVETQRGTTEFYVRNWRDSAHETGAGRWQIYSVDGLRFEIKNIDDLDERSQNLLEQLL